MSSRRPRIDIPGGPFSVNRDFLEAEMLSKTPEELPKKTPLAQRT